MCRPAKWVMLIATEQDCSTESTFTFLHIKIMCPSCHVFSFFQPQLRNRRRMQSRTLILQSSHQATLLAHRHFPQQQDLYQIKTAPPHIWTRAKTVEGLLRPNAANTTNKRPARLFFVFRPM